MTINLESFRYPFETEIANESDGAKVAHRNAFQGILDLNQAVASLKTQLTAATTSTTSSSSSSSSSTSTSTSTGTQTVVTNSATTTIGYVNDQTGVTAYTTLQSDYGKFIILDDASAIAVTLSVGSSAPAITVPWYAVFLNFGAGTATLTPIDGTISYQGNLAAASMPVAQGSAATVAYDGTDFWAELVPLVGGVVTQIIAGTNVTVSPTSGVGAVTVNAVIPAPTLTTLGGVEAIAAVSHEWINSISTDGVPQLSQPAIADISGLSDELALLAPLASPALTGTPTAPTATAGTDTTQIATTAFVESEITAGTVAIAKETLNSLSGTDAMLTLVEGDILSGTDKVRIAVGVTDSDAGYLEIATADNGDEPIYVRQYSGSNDFTTIVHSLTLLDASGNTIIPGIPNIANLSVYADNAAAITGGLVAGDLYRTGSDPDPVCIVH